MNSLEIIRDSEGKEILINTINNNLKLPEPQIIGKKFEDFEIIKLLRKEGGNGKVYKVQSKLNKKIYAMKVLELKELKDLKEPKYLNTLTEPHIVKYYTNFEEGNNLYILMEYLSNGNMNEFIKTKKKLKKHFEEEELWNIFLKCIMGLYYIHKNGVIHRNIKPSSIFLDDDMKAKLGNFGFSSVNKNNYNNKEIKYLGGSYITNTGTQQEDIKLNKDDQKVDVYALGLCFYEIAFFHPHIGGISEEDKQLNYSETLVNLILSMIKENKDEIMTSEQLYEKIGIEYSRIAGNSSVDAMITCFTTLKSLNDNLKDNINKYNDKPITKAYIELIKFLEDVNSNENDWYYNFNNFKKQIGLDNPKLEGTKEIKLNALFEYIIKKLFDETKANISKELDYEKGPHLINSEEGIQQIDENEARLKFDKFFENFDSPIIKNFKGLMKQTNKCFTCGVETYSFSSYFYVNFNLKNILNILNQKSFNILDLDATFKMDNKFTDNFFCSKCYKKTEHKCTKQFYSYPNLLIIYIQRGTIPLDQFEVCIKKNLEVNNLLKKELKKYNLVGLINKIEKDKKEKYISNFYFNNSWYSCERYSSVKKIESPYETYEKIKVNGDIIEEDTVMLFYTSE